jgi:site-specific DNA recombinase
LVALRPAIAGPAPIGSTFVSTHWRTSSSTACAIQPALFKVFCEEFHRELNRLRNQERAEAAAKRAELDQLERRIRRIVELITGDDAPPLRALKQELTALEARQLVLQQELAEAAAPALLLHPNLAEVYRQRVERLQEALQDRDTRDEAFELIRSLIDEIRLVPDKGQLHIELRGELAGILAISADSKEPDRAAAIGRAQQIKMVAGTRNHRQFLVAVDI